MLLFAVFLTNKNMYYLYRIMITLKDIEKLLDEKFAEQDKKFNEM